jgi:hypothetical protein
MLSFTPFDRCLAELVISAGQSEFGVITSRDDDLRIRHDIGVYGSPRWRLSISLDDEWDLQTLPSGRLPSHRTPPEAVEWAYLQWAEGTRAQHTFGALAALPSGRYLVVRSELTPHSARLRLGNEHLHPPDNVLNLLDQRNRSAAAIGPRPDQPPNLTQPLVALTLLNSTGASNTPSLLFFPTTDQSPLGPPAGDLVLVLPVTGELVLDTMTRFSTETPTPDQRAWSTTGAEQFAALLKGSPPSRPATI